MSTAEFDEAMNKIDRVDRVAKYAKSLGATDELAEVFAASQAAKFKWDGVQLTFEGRNVVDDAATKTHFTEGPLKPLFPTATATNKDKPDVAPVLLAAAKAGNKTAEGQLFRELHGDKPKSLIAETQAALVELLAGTEQRDDKGRFTPADDKTKLAKSHTGKNPWSAEHWNATEQSRIFRASPSLATSLAAAQNSRVGAAHPAKRVA
jgi:hypothetical protein